MKKSIFTKYPHEDAPIKFPKESPVSVFTKIIGCDCATSGTELGTIIVIIALLLPVFAPFLVAKTLKHFLNVCANIGLFFVYFRPFRITI